MRIRRIVAAVFVPLGLAGSLLAGSALPVAAGSSWGAAAPAGAAQTHVLSAAQLDPTHYWG